MINKTIFLGVLFLVAGAVNAATTTLTLSENQTTDGQVFSFDFTPGAYEVGSSSSFTVSMQGDFSERQQYLLFLHLRNLTRPLALRAGGFTGYATATNPTLSIGMISNVFTLLALYFHVFKSTM